MDSVASPNLSCGNARGPLVERGRPAVLLAPMEGVTDAPMRAFLTELGGFSFCVSEFLRISQDVPYAKTFRQHVPELDAAGARELGPRTPSGVPVHFQLLGGNPEKLALAASRACEAGALGVDLNFGCPSPTVNGNDGGATLLKYPDRIRTIVAAVRAAVPPGLPVSAKLRLGWDTMDSVLLNSVRAAEGGASWITIHGRTKDQGYRPPVFWGPIGEVRRELGGQVPIVANGDIWTLEDFERCREQTGCEHFMLGRGALADPSLAPRVARALGAGHRGIAGDAAETAAGRFGEPGAWVPLLERFSELCVPFYGPGYIVRRVKQWLNLARAHRRLPWFDDIKRLDTLDELLGWLRAQPL